MIKKIVQFIFFIFLAFLILFRVLEARTLLDWNFSNSDQSYKFIAHAGGAIDDERYTDSKESLENSIKLGFKLIELDFIETSDEHLVAAHDWSYFRKITGETELSDSPLSLINFKSKIILTKYTPMDSNDVVKYMELNKNWLLVTDKSNNFSLINKSFPYSDRIMVEVFGVFSYVKSIFYGIRRPMYNVSVGKFGPMCEYIKVSLLGIRYATAHSSDITKYPDLFLRMKNSGIKLFIYTSNDSNFIKDVISKYDAAVYSDYWDFKNSKCLSLKCETY